MKFADRHTQVVTFLSLNGLLVIAILLWSVRAVDLTLSSCAYLICVALGYYFLALLITVSLLHLILSPLRSLAIGAALLITTTFVYYLILDNFVYNITRMHIDPFWFEWVINDLDAFGLSAATLRTAIFVFLAVLLLEIAIYWIAGRIRRPKRLGIAVAALTVVALGISQVVHIMAYERNNTSITGLTPYLPVYVPLTSHSNAARLGNFLSDGPDTDGVAAEGSQGVLRYPLREIRWDTTSTGVPQNILVIFFESWRSDAMNSQITPNVAALAERSTLCERHFCSGNSTIAGTFGFFYGIAPTYWASVKASNVLIDNPVLIDVLREQGYTFGIFAKSNFKRHKIKDTVFRGIEVHESFSGRTLVEQDADMSRQVIDFLRARHSDQEPFFAMAFYKSNHAPFVYPPEDSVFLPAGDLDLMGADRATSPTSYLNDYHNATHYVDRLVGEILSEVDTLGLDSNTIIIVTTEHGEEFNDNRANYWGHGSNFTLYQTQVPLVFYAPGKSPRRVTDVTSHLDIVPTLLQESLACQNDPEDYSNGLNLFRPIPPSRPLIIGSYVNHAFIIEDNVYEIYPLFNRAYKLHNINEKASAPPPQMLKVVAEDMSRYYVKDGRASSYTAQEHR